METIRKQAEKAAAGEPFGVRELPEHRFADDAPKLAPMSAPTNGNNGGAIEATEEDDVDDAERAEMRRQKRLEALARKRAREAAKES
jgi:hypothetical protein